MIQKQFAALAILLIGASHGYSALVVTPTYSGTEVAFSSLRCNRYKI